MVPVKPASFEPHLGVSTSPASYCVSGECSVSLVLLVLGVDTVQVHRVLKASRFTCPFHNIRVF